MKQTATLFLVAMMLSLTVQCQDQNPVSASWYQLAAAKTIGLRSNFNNREYKIHVSYSTGALEPGKKYPVLYYTDAWEITEMATLFARALVGYEEAIPFILVGISFDASEERFMKLRAEDFKPDLKTDSVNGANHFLQFIKQQLVPYIEDNYPADRSDRGYYGFSLGGLFGAWTLMQEPALFNRMALGSSAGIEPLLQNEAFASSMRQAKNLRIFVSCGSEEQYLEANKKFQQLLEGNASIQSGLIIFDGDTHATSWPRALMSGMKFMYKK